MLKPIKATFPLFTGHAVTRTYYRMLEDCVQHGWNGVVTSGKRSWATQMYLWTMWKARRPGFHLAAPPWASAHCKLGWRCAVDAKDSPNGPLECSDLERIARSRGWPVHRPVPGEPWHLEFSRKPRNTNVSHGPH